MFICTHIYVYTRINIYIYIYIINGVASEKIRFPLRSGLRKPFCHTTSAKYRFEMRLGCFLAPPKGIRTRRLPRCPPHPSDNPQTGRIDRLPDPTAQTTSVKDKD